MGRVVQTSAALGGGGRAGAIAWISSIQFFLAQIVVQSAWTTSFSLTTNYISDLGNTACGMFPVGSTTYVCSPWHAWMNASFVATGIAVILGAGLLRDNVRPSRLALASLALIAVAGVGFILVGLYPENVNFPPHRLGAGLQFVCGNLGQVVFGIAMLRRARGVAFYSIVSGLVGLFATGLFVTGNHGPLAVGGMERLAAYPLPLWTIVTGLRISSAAGSSTT